MPFLRAFQVPPPPAPDTDPPGDVTGLTVTLDDSVPVIDSDTATDNVGVEGYVTERSIDAGASWTEIAFSVTTQQRDEAAALLFGESVIYRRKARDTSVNLSTNWSASSTAVLIPSDDDTDITAPNVPAAPTLVGNTTTDIEISVGTVSDQVVSGDITSGVRRYLVRRDGVFRDYIPHPSINGAVASVEIGDATGGSYSESSGTHTLSTTSGNWYGTADNLRLVSAPVTGDFTVIGRIAARGGSAWSKGAITVRDGLGASSRYIAGLIFPSNGYNWEARTSQGGQAIQGTLAPGSAPGWCRIQRKENLFILSISSNGSSWTQLTALTIAMADTVEVGMGLAGQHPNTPATLTVDNFSITTASSVTYYDVGTPGTTYVYDVAAEDVAGNVSAYGADLSVEMDENASAAVHNYPRLGAGVIGDPQGYPESIWANIARRDIAFIGGDWESWPSQYGSGWRHSVVTGIKSLNPNIKIFQYVLWDTYRTDNLRYPTYDAAIIENGWALYVNGTSGTMVNNFYNSSGVWKQVNPTSATPVDDDGNRATEFFANFVVDEFMGGTTGNRTTALDGFMLDNILQQPRSDGDYDRNGSNDSRTNSAVITAWRNGLRAYVDEIKSLVPGIVVCGNTSDFMSAGGYSFDTADLGPLAGQLQGSFGEYMLGTPGTAIGEWGGFSMLMGGYRFMMAAHADPDYFMFVHGDISSTGIDDASPGLPAYQKLRYGLGCCLLDNGYYYACRTVGYRGDQLDWFDEYWGGSLNTRGYMGQPTQSPPTSAWSNGVWRRDFEHAIVLVNPRGNGSRTVSLGGTFTKLSGSQAPSINNGATVTSVTLSDEDGIVLLR